MVRSPCCEKNVLKKGPWTQEEDQKLIDYIQKHGYGNWRTLPDNAGLQRCGKSCRLRWTNYLRPDIKRGKFSVEEEETIIHLHSILGNKWSLIAARLPGRTDNEIKNFWNTHIRRRLLRMGIDPVTHTPRLELVHLSRILTSSLYNNNNEQSLAVQPFLNHDFIRLAAPLFCSHAHNQDYLIQNTNNNLHIMSSNQLIPPPLMPNTYWDHTTPDASIFSTHNQLMQHVEVNEFSQNTLTQDYVHMPYDNHYESSQTFVDPTPSSETSTLQSIFSNISSPTLMHLNPTNYVDRSSSTEDERQSYYTSMLKYEIPSIAGVNDFM